MQRDKIEVGNIVEIISRPDLGLIVIEKVLKFGKFICVRTSRGGVFDEFDLLEPASERIDMFKKNGRDANHSKRDWLKSGGDDMVEFNCNVQGGVINSDKCKECFFVERKSPYPVSRAYCRHRMQRAHLEKSEGKEVEQSIDSKKNDKPDNLVEQLEKSDDVQKIRLKVLNETANKS